ncbi:MAG: C4-dicarboxylate ABC transporter permease, partial [Comamonadaceae bacterium]
NALFDLWILLGFGVAAWVLEENGFPVAPAILGMLLGKMLEENFITSMIKSDGNLMGFVSRPIAASLAAVSVLIWLAPVATRLLARGRAGGRPPGSP